MKKILFLLIPGFILLLIGCNNETSTKTEFKTKKDSIQFAKAILQIYPEAQEPQKAGFGDGSQQALSIDKMKPIAWTRLKSFAGNYDKIPFLKNVQGFFIDANGLESLRRNNAYNQLYVRFGKHTDDENINNDYTIMFIPLKADSTVLHKGDVNVAIDANNNYNYVDPCPVVCPKDF